MRLRFNRNEFSGAFGDLGTDFPLLLSLILVSGLDAASVLVMFGLMQIFTALTYGLPMPVQPLKAMAVLVITQKLPADTLYGGGLAIGLIMLALTGSGLFDRLARVIPKPVVRGIQFGLGLQLMSLALKEHVQADGPAGYVLAAASFAVILLLLGNRRYPPAPFVILLGVVYALWFKLDLGAAAQGFGFALPRPRLPHLEDLVGGLIPLALPQLPLSLANSVLATRQAMEDLFPQRAASVRKIGLTYSFMNLINPFFGGVPTCHGAGGLAGHYAFGGRTGGSVFIYGLMYLTLGLFFSRGFGELAKAFPLPVLGVLLLFEGLALTMLVRDLSPSPSGFFIVILVGLLCGSLPYGYLVGLIVGTLLYYAAGKAPEKKEEDVAPGQTKVFPGLKLGWAGREENTQCSRKCR